MLRREVWSKSGVELCSTTNNNRNQVLYLYMALLCVRWRSWLRMNTYTVILPVLLQKTSILTVITGHQINLYMILDYCVVRTTGTCVNRLILGHFGCLIIT